MPAPPHLRPAASALAVLAACTGCAPVLGDPTIGLTDLACRLAGSVSHPLAAYWLPAAALYGAVVALSLLPLLRPRDSVLARDGWYFASVLLAMVSFRWIFFTHHQENVDESQELAAALTLLADPVFWRSVDLGTHGPLVTYPLLLFRLAGLPLDFGAAKALNLLLMGGSVLLAYCSLRDGFGKAAARVAVLPAVTLVSLMYHQDFLAYNAEQAAVLLLSASLWVQVRAYLAATRRSYRVLGFVQGALLGLVLLTKLQAVPVALAILCFHPAALVREPRWRKDWPASLLPLPAGLLAVVALFLLYAAAFGLLGDVWQRYLVAQFVYAGRSQHGFADKLHLLLQHLFAPNAIDHVLRGYVSAMLWLSALLASLLLALVSAGGRTAAPRSPEGPAPRPVLFVPLLSLAYLAASAYAVLAPGNFFWHYYQFLLLPLALVPASLFCLAMGLLRGNAARLALVGLFLACGAGGQFVRGHSFQEHRQALASAACPGTVKHLPSRFLVPLKRPGDTLFVWGWAHLFNVETGLPLATRTTTCQLFTDNDAQRDYYSGSLARELAEQRPAWIVDAVAPGMFAYTDRSSNGFGQFPAIRRFVEENYVKVGTVTDLDIYLRADAYADRRDAIEAAQGGRPGG